MNGLLPGRGMREGAGPLGRGASVVASPGWAPGEPGAPGGVSVVGLASPGENSGAAAGRAGVWGCETEGACCSAGAGVPAAVGPGAPGAIPVSAGAGVGLARVGVGRAAVGGFGAPGAIPVAAAAGLASAGVLAAGGPSLSPVA